MNQANKNLWFLIVAQTLFMAMNMMFMTLAPLMGKQVAGNANLATVPLAIALLTMLLLSFPLSMWMGKIGRALIFRSGIVASMLAGGIFSYAIYINHFYLLLVGAIFFGYSVACANFYRFAAMEMVDKSAHASAMAKIMAVGVVAGFIGPNLAKFSKDFYFDQSFVSSVLLFVPLSFIALASMFLIRWPEHKQVQQTLNTPSSSQTTSILVFKPILTAMVAYAVMILIMSATPLHMEHQQYHFDDTAWVIQWHIIGMFAPSFFIAKIVKKIGVVFLLIWGVLILFASIYVNLIAQSKFLLTLGLLLLGIGWNFLFSGASQWLMQFLHDGNRAKIQGLNEVLVFGLSSAAVLSSGWFINEFGWEKLNLTALPLLLVLFVVLIHSVFNPKEKQ